MRILLALLLVVGLGAASPRTPGDSDPVSLITAIYKTYAEDKDKDNPGLPHVYSKRLQALVDKDEKETPEGMVGRIDEAQADATVRAAWDSGIRYFDTSPWYGHGLSEHRTGHMLRTLPRGEFVLSTKVGRIFHRPKDPATFSTGQWQGGLPFDYRRDYTAAGVQRSYEDSLLRLGMNRVDMLFVHDIDQRHMSLENNGGGVGGIERAFWQLECGGGWQHLSDMRASGEIGAIGFGAAVD